MADDIFTRILAKQFKENHCLNTAPCEHTVGGCGGCTHPKHPDIIAMKRAEEKANEIHVDAFDKKGNTFDKIVEFKEDENSPIIDFGGPCSYYIKDLLKNYPMNNDLCIDMCGLNHRGSAVCISKDDINRLLEPYSV